MRSEDSIFRVNDSSVFYYEEQRRVTSLTTDCKILHNLIVLKYKLNFISEFYCLENDLYSKY